METGPGSTTKGFLRLNYCHFGSDSFLDRDCAVHCGKLDSIPGLYALDSIQQDHLLVVSNAKMLKHVKYVGNTP